MEDNLKSLYIMNPLLTKNTKRYIWGNDKNASELFVHLCESGIKVDGFICDKYKGTILWNKPVVAYADIEGFNVTICISDKEADCEMPIGNCMICRGTESLNPEFDRKQAVIYGAGMMGRHVLKFLRTENIDVLCFVDSNNEIVGREIDGILVEDVSYLEKLPDTAYIIEAGKYYKEIDKTVTQYIGTNKRFFWEKGANRNPREIMIDAVRGVGLNEIVYLEGLGRDRKFYLYGDSALSHKYRKVLELLGFQVDEVKDKIDNTSDKCVVDLLYEENYLILLVGGV